MKLENKDRLKYYVGVDWSLNVYNGFKREKIKCKNCKTLNFIKWFDGIAQGNNRAGEFKCSKCGCLNIIN